MVTIPGTVARGPASPAEPAASSSPSPSPAPRSHRPQVARRMARHLGMIALFTIPSVLLWWDVWTGHPSTALTCGCGDPAQEAWFLAWPAYALIHGLNPFFSSWIFVPRGANLLVNTSSPLAGIVLAPVTWLFGPTASVNVALTLAPGLSAWGCWVAARRLVAPGVGAVLAGLVFGYSPFVVGGLRVGHVWSVLLVFPPLMVVCVHQLVVTRKGSAVCVGAALGALAFLQFLVSTELLTVTVISLVVGLAAAMVLAPRAVRPALPWAVRGFGAALVVALVLLAYPAWLALAGPRHFVGIQWDNLVFSGIRVAALGDPGNYAAPATALGHVSGWLGPKGPPSEYIGAPALIALPLCALVAWRRRLTWALVIVGVVIGALSLGTYIFWTGADIWWYVWAPWKLFQNLPVLRMVTPSRFFVTVSFCAAMLVALGVDALRRFVIARWAPTWHLHLRRGGSGAWRPGAHILVDLGLVVAVGLAFLLPTWRTYQVPMAVRQVQTPQWFTTAARTLAPGTVVLSYPFPLSGDARSAPMLWQAQDGMRFKFAGGFIKVPGPGGTVVHDGSPGTVLHDLFLLTEGPTNQLPRGTPVQLHRLRAALAFWGVGRIVVTMRGASPAYAAAYFTAAVGRGPLVSHGAWVWNLERVPVSRAYHAEAASAALSRCALVALRRPPSNMAASSLAGSRCVVQTMG